MDGDAMLDAQVCGKIPLKPIYFRTQNKTRVSENRGHGFVDLVLQWRILSGKIKKENLA
jgi:hypothetical protein